MAWRVDASIAGPSTVLGDIGTHAHHLMRRITGTRDRIAVGGVIDDGPRTRGRRQRLREPALSRRCAWPAVGQHGRGRQWARVAHPCLRREGEPALGQESPDELFLRADGAPYRTLRRGEAYLCADARHASRTKAGNPEGYFGAFANIYADAAEVIGARRAGPGGRSLRVDIRDGARRRPRNGLHRGGGRLASQRRGMDPCRARRGPVVRHRRGQAQSCPHPRFASPSPAPARSASATSSSS